MKSKNKYQNQLNFKIMKTIKRSLLIGIALLITGTISAQQQFRYIGADNCKTCHNSPEKGRHYDMWLLDIHSQALKVLSTEKAADIAKARGIADAATDASCLKCHSTFHAAPANLRNGIKEDEGISCEGCHGAGSSYRTPAVKRNRSVAVRSGLIIQDETSCAKCHNSEAPFYCVYGLYKGLDFEKAFIKASHLDPDLPKNQEKLDKLK